MGEVVAVTVLLITGAGGVLWTMKTIVGAIVRQNEALTKSLQEQTAASTRLTQALDRYIAIQEERDKGLVRQLDRIERAVTREG